MRHEGDVVGADHDLHAVAGLEIAHVAEHAHLRDDALAGHQARQEVGGSHELGDELRRGVVVDVLRGGELLDSPRVHDAHAVSQGEGFLLVVGDEDGGGAGVPQDGLDLVPHLRAKVGIEIREGLVEQDESGCRGERPGHRHPLLLSSGELVGVACAEAREPDQLQDLGDTLPPRAPIQAMEAEAHVVLDGEVREEGVVLEDDADPALLGRHGAAGTRHHLIADGHGAGVRSLEARDEAQGRGLSAPGGTQQGQDLALLDREGEPVHGRRSVRGVALAQLGECEELHRQPRLSTSGFTGVGGVLSSSTARQFSTARFAIWMRVSWEALAMWGASTTLGRPTSSGCTLGSCS